MARKNRQEGGREGVRETGPGGRDDQASKAALQVLLLVATVTEAAASASACSREPERVASPKNAVLR